VLKNNFDKTFACVGSFLANASTEMLLSLTALGRDHSSSGVINGAPALSALETIVLAGYLDQMMMGWTYALWAVGSGSEVTNGNAASGATATLGNISI
jgi:hypothetical protein